MAISSCSRTTSITTSKRATRYVAIRVALGVNQRKSECDLLTLCPPLFAVLFGIADYFLFSYLCVVSVTKRLHCFFMMGTNTLHAKSDAGYKNLAFYTDGDKCTWDHHGKKLTCVTGASSASSSGI